jgi:hypothetical protein
VDVTEGVTGVGVDANVDVDITVAVSVGCGVIVGMAEGSMTCGAEGAQALEKRTITNSEKFFIVRLVEHQPPASNC